jgi:hypothetical protein
LDHWQYITIQFSAEISAEMPSWSILPAAPTLNVEFSELDNNIFFLYPTPQGLAPVADTNVEGKVILELPVAKKVKTVAVQLVRHER